jgi:hypothetical protein
MNYKVFYKSCKLFLGIILFFGADNPKFIEAESSC